MAIHYDMDGHMAVNVVEILDVAPITDLETLRILSDSQRHRIVTVLMDEALTAKEVAQRLGLGRTRLYHHFGLLEQHGIIRVSGTRLVSGIVERTYRAVARAFRVDRSLLSSPASLAGITDAQASIVEAVAQDLHARAKARPSAEDDVLASRAFLKLNAAHRKNLRERLTAIVAEYRDGDPDGDETEVATVMFTVEGEPS